MDARESMGSETGILAVGGNGLPAILAPPPGSAVIPSGRSGENVPGSTDGNLEPAQGKQ